MEGGIRRGGEKKDYFHVIHKVPVGDSPYVRAKHLQDKNFLKTTKNSGFKAVPNEALATEYLVDKDLDASVVWFWKAINNGDRVDSALKDMALVMKQQNRPEEAIEAIKSFRYLCSKQAQESLDNVLIDLYKKCGMIEEQIALLKKKLKLIFTGEAFNGKTTKTARSHGKKFQVSITQETSRVLGNLGWAYMQQGKYRASEAVYLKAQMIDADANKACNLSLCLIKQGRFEEARNVLMDVLSGRLPVTSTDSKIMRRAAELLQETELQPQPCNQNTEEVIERISILLNEWASLESIFDHSTIFEEISHQSDGIAC